MAAARRSKQMAPVQDSRKGFSEDDYNVTVADKDGEIKKMLLKLKEVGKAPEFVAQQLSNLDKDVRATREHAQKRRDQVASDTAELRQLESQLKEASAKIAALQKRKSESDAAAGRVEKHLKSALGELTGHVTSANHQRKSVLNKQEAATSKYTRGQLAAERGFDATARVPVRLRCHAGETHTDSRFLCTDCQIPCCFTQAWSHHTFKDKVRALSCRRGPPLLLSGRVQLCLLAVP